MKRLINNKRIDRLINFGNPMDISFNIGTENIDLQYLYSQNSFSIPLESKSGFAIVFWGPESGTVLVPDFGTKNLY